MSSSGNPRKFSEKIALQQQKLVEQQREFESVMREVEDATKKKSPSVSDGYDSIGDYPPSFQGNNFGGPGNYPEFSTSTGNRGIDLPDALRNLHSLTRQGPQQFEFANDRNFLVRQSDLNNAYVGSHQNMPGNALPFNMPPPGPFLPVPMENNWRRTHSDSSLHATVMGSTASTMMGAAGPVPHQMVSESVHRDRRRQHFSAKTRSTDYNNGFPSSVPYSLVSPMASLSVNKPATNSFMQQGTMIQSPAGGMSGLDGFNGGGDGLQRFDSSNALVPITNATIEKPSVVHQTVTMARVPNRGQHDPLNVATDGYPSSYMRNGPNSLGNVDTGLLNTSSLPDLTVALARGTALPSGFSVADQFTDINSRSPASRIHKHRVVRSHMRPIVSRTHPSQNPVSYLTSDGRSISHADMVALSSGSVDCDVSVGSLPSGTNAANGVPSMNIYSQMHQQPQQSLECRFEHISMDPSQHSSYAQSQQNQSAYQPMYQDHRQAMPHQMVGLNQRIPEICIEAPEDFQQLQIPTSNSNSQFSPSIVNHQGGYSISGMSMQQSVNDPNSGNLYYDQPLFDGSPVGNLQSGANTISLDNNGGVILSDPNFDQSQQHFYTSSSPASTASISEQTYQSWQR